MPALERRPLGRTGLEVTRIGFGALEIGRDWGIGDEAARRRPEAEAAGEVLNGVLDLGINLIDTARAYHRSEERIGASIAARRGEYVLATKCGEHSLDRCIESGDFEVLQVGYSLLDRGAHDLIAKAGDRGIGILIRGGLGAGWLTPRALTVPADRRPEKVRALLDLVGGDGAALHALSLAFLRSQPAISSILVGSRSVDNLRQNVARFTEPVDPALLERALALT
jgi:aryl-alcohol dehydrogenase-like predicted oxidoreductase